MAEWQARLNGHEIDLETLARSSSTDWFVVQHDARYYLGSTMFNSLEDASHVQILATQTIQTIAALARLKYTDFGSVQIDAVARIDEDRSYHHFLLLHATMRARSRTSRPTLTVSESPTATMDTVQQPQATLLGSGVAIARHDSNVAEALRVFGTHEDNWFNLYRILEIVKCDVGGSHKLVATGWVSNRRLDRFKRTANRPELSGDGARHARGKGRPPLKAMSIAEAKALIGTILTQWIASKMDSETAGMAEEAPRLSW
jgi:hypothetical protein